MRVHALHIYPIKSTRGHDLDSAQVEPWGLAGDRRYLVVDANGTMLTAREFPKLLSCRAELAGGTLTLTGPHAAPLLVRPATALTTVSVWRTDVDLRDCGDEAATWLSALLEHPVRLKWLDDPTRRPVDPDHGRPEDRVSLADGYPLLLTSTSSLARLNDWIAEGAVERGEDPPSPLPMGRFRPNVVVDGVAEPFAEDEWKRVRIGALGFRVSMGCPRCVLTTIDHSTHAKGKEPIRTLARHRKWDGKTWFGMLLIPDTTGRVSVGDPVVAM